MSEFIGHLHPALVHLPIGILLIALLLIFLSNKTKYNISHEAIKIVLLTGVFSALLSCVTGYILSMQDSYEKPLVIWHMWMGISVAIVSMLLYMKLARKEFGLLYKTLAIGLFILIFITGHLGGSLTHGSDYLSFSTKEDTVILKPIVNVQEAKVYADVIAPIFQAKCYSCHSAKKQKGDLRLDKYDLIMKGGKDGKIIETNYPDKSDLIKVLLLPAMDDKHMPPKDKPQPNEKQIALLHWWIENGNDTLHKVKELLQPEPIKSYLLSLQQDHAVKQSAPIVPPEAVDKADEKAIEALKNKGIVVMPVAQNSNYISANFVAANNITNADVALLIAVKKQLVWLKCGNTKIGDSAMKYIAECTNINFLQLDNTLITDDGVKQLSSLSNLQSLNLVATNITANGLQALKNLKQLKSLYLYQTKIDKKDWAILQKEFSATQLDSGGYNVPLYPNDTVVVKAPAYK